MELGMLAVSLAVIVGPLLLPRGVVVKSVRPFLNGTLTTYDRVSGIRALRHKLKGELEQEILH